MASSRACPPRPCLGDGAQRHGSPREYIYKYIYVYRRNTPIQLVRFGMRKAPHPLVRCAPQNPCLASGPGPRPQPPARPTTTRREAARSAADSARQSTRAPRSYLRGAAARAWWRPRPRGGLVPALRRRRACGRASVLKASGGSVMATQGSERGDLRGQRLPTGGVGAWSWALGPC